MNTIAMNQPLNQILYGPPGTGKTTTIINLINAYQAKLNIKNKDTEMFNKKTDYWI